MTYSDLTKQYCDDHDPLDDENVAWAFEKGGAV